MFDVRHAKFVGSAQAEAQEPVRERGPTVSPESREEARLILWAEEDRAADALAMDHHEPSLTAFTDRSPQSDHGTLDGSSHCEHTVNTMSDRRRAERKILTLTASEAAALESAAERAGLTFTGWARLILLEHARRALRGAR